jgi:hypothetical protein
LLKTLLHFSNENQPDCHQDRQHKRRNNRQVDPNLKRERKESRRVQSLCLKKHAKLLLNFVKVNITSTILLNLLINRVEQRCCRLTLIDRLIRFKTVFVEYLQCGLQLSQTLHPLQSLLTLQPQGSEVGCNALGVLDIKLLSLSLVLEICKTLYPKR